MLLSRRRSRLNDSCCQSSSWIATKASDPTSSTDTVLMGLRLNQAAHGDMNERYLVLWIGATVCPPTAI